MALYRWFDWNNPKEFQEVMDRIDFQFDPEKHYSLAAANANLKIIERKADLAKEKYVGKINRRSEIGSIGAGLCMAFVAWTCYEYVRNDVDFRSSDEGKELRYINSKIDDAESAKNKIMSASNNYIVSLKELNDFTLAHADSSNVCEGLFYYTEAANAALNSTSQINSFLDNRIQEYKSAMNDVQNTDVFGKYASEQNNTQRSGIIGVILGVVLTLGARNYRRKKTAFAAEAAEDLKKFARDDHRTYLHKFRHEFTGKNYN